MPIADVAALVATALAVVGALCQLRRLVRTADPSGVSLANAMLGVMSELGWLAYTVHESLWSAVPEVALMIGTNVLLAWALVRAGAVPGRPLAAATAWGAALAAGTAVGGWALLGTMLPIAYAIQVVPSVWSAYRTWAPSGVATTMWMLVLVECALWGVYGVARSDPALTMFGVIGTSSAAAIIVRMAVTRDRVRSVRVMSSPASRLGVPPARITVAGLRPPTR